MPNQKSCNCIILKDYLAPFPEHLMRYAGGKKERKRARNHKWEMFYAKDPLHFFTLTYLGNALKYAFSLFDALQCARRGRGLNCPVVTSSEFAHVPTLHATGVFKNAIK